MSGAKTPRMVGQMVAHKALHKVVAVVVARVAAQAEWLADGLAGGFEQVRMQLLGQKLVGEALVDEDARRVGRDRLVLHEHRGVVLDPSRAVCAQVARE
eukprot:gene56-77_t